MPIIATRFEEKRSTPPWGRTLFWLVVRIVGVVVVVLGMLYLFQDYFLYDPSRYTVDEAMDVGRHRGLKHWPQGITRDQYRAFIPDRLPGGESQGTVIIAHGNAGSAVDRFLYVEPLHRLGYRVVIMEYPGYGARSGRPGEEVFAEELRAITREIDRTGGSPIYLFGESLGAGVVASALKDPELPVQGALLVTPWNNLADVAQHHFWFLPVRGMLRDSYDSAANLARFKGPVVVAVAENDQTIPPEEALALYDALPFPKRLIRFPGAGHNTWPSDPAHPWWRQAMKFLSSQPASSQ